MDMSQNVHAVNEAKQAVNYLNGDASIPAKTVASRLDAVYQAEATAFDTMDGIAGRLDVTPQSVLIASAYGIATINSATPQIESGASRLLAGDFEGFMDVAYDEERKVGGFKTLLDSDRPQRASDAINDGDFVTAVAELSGQNENRQRAETYLRPNKALYVIQLLTSNKWGVMDTQAYSVVSPVLKALAGDKQMVGGALDGATGDLRNPFRSRAVRSDSKAVAVASDPNPDGNGKSFIGDKLALNPVECMALTDTVYGEIRQHTDATPDSLVPHVAFCAGRGEATTHTEFYRLMANAGFVE
jgi:hypothetical protein